MTHYVFRSRLRGLQISHVRYLLDAHLCSLRPATAEEARDFEREDAHLG